MPRHAASQHPAQIHRLRRTLHNTLQDGPWPAADVRVDAAAWPLVGGCPATSAALRQGDRPGPHGPGRAADPARRDLALGGPTWQGLAPSPGDRAGSRRPNGQPDLARVRDSE
jgi:hypothetical protein